MPGVGHDAQLRPGPALVQLPSGFGRTHHVVTPLDDHGRNVPQRPDSIDQLGLRLEEAAVDEVVRLEARNRDSEVGIGKVLLALLVREQRAQHTLPDRPGSSKSDLLLLVAAREAPMIRGEQVVALVFRYAPGEFTPVLGKDRIRAAPVEPVELLAAHEEYAAQDQLRYRVRMSLRIGERKRAAPRASEDEPPVDLEPTPQPLDVRDEVPGRVRLERRKRAAAPAPALVERDDSIAPRVEEAPRVPVSAPARSAVHEQRGLAARIAALLVIDAVSVADVEIAGLERLDRRIQLPRARPCPLVQPDSSAREPKAHGGGERPPLRKHATRPETLATSRPSQPVSPTALRRIEGELSGRIGVALKHGGGLCRIGRRRYRSAAFRAANNAGLRRFKGGRRP